MNRRIRNRMYGGVGGRRVRALLLPDWTDVYSFHEFRCRSSQIQAPGFAGDL